MKKITLYLVYIISILLMFFISGCGDSDTMECVNIAIPYSYNVQDYDSNYYINWLKDKTGIDIEVTVIRSTRSDEYLNTFSENDSDIDAVLFGGDFNINEAVLKEYINKSSYSDSQGKRLYYNSSGQTKSSGCGQVLWINREWLEELGMSIPSDTEKLYDVLHEFKVNDLNHNGINDEIALLGCTDEYQFDPVCYILNSYVYTDPYHSYYRTDEHGSYTVADLDEFREGLDYCARLYREDIIDNRLYVCTRESMAELINSRDDLVGAFTTDSIADVIYQDNPEIMARYVHVPPVKGPKGVRNAIYREYKPSIGAVINYRTQKYNLIKKVLDTMMSTEASLIARYGEEGVDWEYADRSNSGLNGSDVAIVTKNYIWNTRQNKHLGGIGLMKLPDRFLTGVIWNGVNSDTEYVDTRAKKRYEEYLPEYVPVHEYDSNINKYIDYMIYRYVRGDIYVEDDKNWNDYCNSVNNICSK